MAEDTESGSTTATASGSVRARMGKQVTRARSRLAKVLWLLCAFAALVLAVGALLVALQGSGTNPDNALYQLVVDTAERLDFGVFSPSNGLFDFTGKDGDTLDVLSNWALAAIVWLIAGRILERVVRP